MLWTSVHPFVIIIIIIIISATWDVTVVHTLAASYIQQSAVEAGNAASAASERKSAKYSNVAASHMFYPVAVSTATG